ncbi:Cytidylate kinase [Candidatus Anstonella stagnisolia]|nr:Cytidylate kinase [Candidatus Anstonella stagnisolia]
MIICVGGFTACGKNTVGKYVAEALGLRIVDPTFKDLAALEGIPLMEFQKKAAESKNGEIDRKFDDELRRQASAGNCVITTWLAPWMVKNADFRVWLVASEKVRAKRLAGREGMSEEEAIAHIKKRDADNIARYKKVYGIDITKHEIFDLQINVEKIGAKEVAEKIVKAIKEKQ